jgi:hypothetical protein
MKTLKYKSAILILLFIACKSEVKKDVNETVTKQPKKEVATKTNKSTYLCTINGKDWAYTKASGIIDKNPKTGKLTAIFTFKKKLEKGSESIQLYYAANSFELEGADLQLKVMKKSGKLGTSFYSIKPGSRKIYTQTKLSGSIDLSNTTKASGIAKIENITMSKYEKKELKNQEDEEISITDLKFTDIGYSNLDKVFTNLKK